MKTEECIRMVRIYAKDSSDTYYDTGARHITDKTARNCTADKDECLVGAHISNLTPTPKDERMELDVKKSEWREGMRHKMPEFQVKKYKYITITRVQG